MTLTAFFPNTSLSDLEGLPISEILSGTLEPQDSVTFDSHAIDGEFSVGTVPSDDFDSTGAAGRLDVNNGQVSGTGVIFTVKSTSDAPGPITAGVPPTPTVSGSFTTAVGSSLGWYTGSFSSTPTSPATFPQGGLADIFAVSGNKFYMMTEAVNNASGVRPAGLYVFEK